MDLKSKYTRIFLSVAGFPVTDASVKEHRSYWWANIRDTDHGLKLTEKGLQFVRYRANITAYQVQLKCDSVVTAKTILQLDEFITCPWGFNHGMIILFGEQMACELMLFSGDINRLVSNKEDAMKFHQGTGD